MGMVAVVRPSAVVLTGVSSYEKVAGHAGTPFVTLTDFVTWGSMATARFTHTA
jgi:hypothetical protein